MALLIYQGGSTMSFSDPQSITVNSVAKTLNRVRTEPTKSLYSSDDEAYKLTISHQESKGRTRHMARIDSRVIAADPLSAVNEYKNLGAYVVIDEPEYGFTDTDIDYVVDALTAWLSAANIAKLLTNQT